MKLLLNVLILSSLSLAISCQSNSDKKSGKNGAACVPNPNYQPNSTQYQTTPTDQNSGYYANDPYSNNNTYDPYNQNTYDPYNQNSQQYDPYNQGTNPNYQNNYDQNSQKVTYLKDIKPLMTKYCVSCHSVSGQQSDLSDLSQPGLLPSKGQIIVQRVMLAPTSQGAMPPQNSGMVMTAMEKQLFQTWETQSQYAVGTNPLNSYDQYPNNNTYNNNYNNNYTNTTSPCL